MENREEFAQKSADVLDMWVLRGSEMKRILRASGLSVEEFAHRFGRSMSAVRAYFDLHHVKSVWRDRLMLAVGDEFYFRELLTIREREGRANEMLRQHVCALNARRQKRPIDLNARR